MPAGAERFGSVPPRERAVALGVAVVIQVALGLALLSGLRVDFSHPRDAVERLIEIGVPPPPPTVRLKPAKPKPEHAEKKAESAPRSAAVSTGGSPGPAPAHAPPSVAPAVVIHPSAAPSGGGTGTGPAAGSGAGGGADGEGYGGDAGGTDLELISGDIAPRDYPKHLGNAGIGGRVTVTFTVQVNGRATGCRVSRSSGIPELDALTCRLIEQRFRFRPSTDRYGRPVPEEVDWDHDWIAG
jgi:protein TonB